MKKFVFSLEKVLKLKQQLLDVKINEMTVLQLALKKIDDEIEQLNLEFGNHNRELNSSMKNGISPKKAMIYKMYFNNITEQINICNIRKYEVIKQIQLKQNELVSLKSEISGYEKLKEKQREEYDKILQKQFELEIEEFINKKCIAS